MTLLIFKTHSVLWLQCLALFLKPLVCCVLQGLGGEPGPVPVHRRGLCLPVCSTHPDFDPRSAGALSMILSCSQFELQYLSLCVVMWFTDTTVPTFCLHDLYRKGFRIYPLHPGAFLIQLSHSTAENTCTLKLNSLDKEILMNIIKV